MNGEEIITTCGPLIRTLAWRAARAFGDDFEDWFQDLVFEVLKFANKYDPARGALTTWVALRWRRLVALRKRPDLKRNRRPKPCDPTELCIASLADGRRAGPLEAAELEDVRRHVRERMAGLTARERMVLEARFDHRLTNDEVGAALGVSKARAWQLEKNGLRRLARLMTGV